MKKLSKPDTIYDDNNGLPYENYDNTASDYSINIGGKYGDMPSEMLMAKFDETNMDDNYRPFENLDNHWRDVLRDLTPEPRSLESDQVRRDNQSKQFLNLRYHGAREVSDVEVHHPEMFLGFSGEEDREPRGGNTGTNPMEPNFRKLTEQNQARLKYIKFAPDSCNNITGLGRSEAKAQADNLAVRRQVRHRTNIFSTSLDGRRSGLSTNRAPNCESRVFQQVGLDGDYSEKIRQLAMIRGSKTTTLSNTLFRNTNMYHQNTTDHVFQVAAYGENPRRFNLIHPLENVIMNIATEQELAYPEEVNDLTRGKAVNLLMGKAVLQRHKAEEDIEKGKSVQNVVGKTKAQEKDLQSVITKLSNDTDKKDGIETRNGKNGTEPPVNNVSRKETFAEDQDRRNEIATIMFKTINGEKDVRKAQNDIAHEQNMKDISFGNLNGKNATRKDGSTSNFVNKNTSTVLEGKSLETVSYKSAPERKNVSHGSGATQDGDYGKMLMNSAYKNATPEGTNLIAPSMKINNQATMGEDIIDTNTRDTANTAGKMSERGVNSSIYKSTRDNTNTFAEMSSGNDDAYDGGLMSESYAINRKTIAV